MTCIFCQILAGSIPAKIVYEDDVCVAFNDLHPQAKTHLLIIPRRHIESVLTVQAEDSELVGRLLFVAGELARERGIEGFKVQINVGVAGGQEVPHLHLHFLAD